MMIWKRLFGGGDSGQGRGRRVSERHGDSVIEYTLREGAQPPPEDDAIGWEPSNALEEQMAQIPQSVEAQFAFARLLLESDVLLATAQSSESPGARTLEDDEPFQILAFDDKAGGTVAGMFTSQERLVDALGAGSSYVQMNGRTALETVAQLGVIINPGPGLWTRYDPPTIARILSGNI